LSKVRFNRKSLFYSGEFTGSIKLTFAYDPALEPLALYNWDGKTWKHLNCQINSKSKTVTTAVNSLGWFALGYESVAGAKIHPGMLMLLLDADEPDPLEPPPPPIGIQ